MVEVGLRPLGEADIEEHNAVEDAAIVRWPTGQKGTAECDYVRDHGIGARAALRIEPDNIASLGAERAGFRFVCEFSSATRTPPDSSPATMRLYVRDL